MKKISKVINRVAWISLSKTFKHVGKNSHVEEKFSIIGSQYISIGDDFSGGRNLKIHAFDIDDLKKPMIIIGNDVTITDNCYISAAGEITRMYIILLALIISYNKLIKANIEQV